MVLDLQGTNSIKKNKDVSNFEKDVREGLTASSKYLSSKYFYDHVGDELFIKIMELDEYYLTRAEFDIFRNQKAEIQNTLTGDQPFRLIELGAGDGVKTLVLLEYFSKNKIDFTFCPLDISPNVLEILEKKVRERLPNIQMESLAGDYFKVLHDIKVESHVRNVVFFLGSNIGNFTKDLARTFFENLHNNLNKKDLVMIGFDLKKDPATILSAYNDKKGVTRDFNFNLLSRINRELGGNFDLESFSHYPVYDPSTGECTSYVISQKAQQVNIKDLGLVVTLEKWEPIKMEISRKFSPDDIHQLASASGFRVVKDLFDQNGFFCESIWEVV